MILPELRRVLKRFLPDDAPIALNLKSAGLSFNTTNVPDVNWLLRNGYPGIAAALTGGMPAWSGEAVSVTSALNHSVVWTCNRIISEAIGSLPANLMRQRSGAKELALDHPMYRAMRMAPNDEISAQGFKETHTSHCALQGNGYAKIIRRSGTGVAIELQSLLPNQVEPDREKTGQKRLVYIFKRENGAVDKTYTVDRGKPHDILHLRGLGYDGVQGYSVIQMARQSIGTAIAGEKNVASFWANGGRVPYIIQKAKFRDGDDFEEFRKEWETTYAQPHKVPILEGETAEYKQIGLSMEDAQALETRLFTVAEICRWFKISPHLAQDLSHATFSNIEQLALDFVKFTLFDWVTRWEQDFWRCVLTPDEKEDLFLKINVNAFLRGDFRSRMEGYSSALQNGHMNIDEVRDLEDRNPLPNGAGQTYRTQLNMQTIPGTGEPGAVEQGILARTATQQTAQKELR